MLATCASSNANSVTILAIEWPPLGHADSDMNMAIDREPPLGHADIKHQNNQTNTEKHIKHIKKCNVKIENIGIPMVYVENNISEHAIENVGVKKFEKKSKNLDLILFSHVSHIWKKDSFNPGFSNSKRNHILINGFAKYINNYK